MNSHFSVWTSVQVIRADHERGGQAGSVYEVSPDVPGEVVVKFDIDGNYVAVDVNDLKAL